jgi:hypothetical protein
MPGSSLLKHGKILLFVNADNPGLTDESTQGAASSAPTFQKETAAVRN